MQTAQEIVSNLKSVRYYTAKIAELARQQLKLDCEKAEQIGMNSGPGSMRFDCLGAISSNCDWISTYCDNIESNLKTAISQDKMLYDEHYIEETALEEE